MKVEGPIPADVLNAIRAPFAGARATATDAPILLPLGPLLDLAGEAMRGRLFIVQGDGEDACLRPDFTIAIAHAHIGARGAAARLAYEGKAFRVAPRGTGRAEEFLQIGLEVFGEGRGAGADAEVAALAWRAAAAGGRGDLSMILGDIALFGALIDAMGLAPALAARLKRAFARGGALAPEIARAQSGAPTARQGDRVAALLAGLPEPEAVAALEDLWGIAGIQPVGGRSALEIAHRLVQRGEAARGPRLSPAEAGLIHDFVALDGPPGPTLDAAAALAKRGRLALDAPLDDWAQRLAAFKAAGGPDSGVRLSAGFGRRAFNYYDGFLFEIRSAALDDEAPVAAGGRYDGLLASLGGGAAGAVGCAIRPGRAWAGGAA
ncbi:MAG TPA: ATP phosphoribosyltransferase regulatory subunit [Caulobacteraceae bacterium]|nr:ATP phosphoribosyltransferase regulatory subunit [Caulobacteraceae bacterium]